MVAYSFKLRFIPNIRAGLGMKVEGLVRPKLQTIRAERRRHANPGEEVQLYYAQRTSQCQLIGKPTCASVVPIEITFRRFSEMVDIGDIGTLSRAPHLDRFAQLDGFFDWEDMRQFWMEEHQAVMGTPFTGKLIRWNPVAG